MNHIKGYTTVELVITLVGLFSAIGWVSNLVKLVSGGIPDPLVLEFILRLGGVFVAPVGVVLGYIPIGY